MNPGRNILFTGPPRCGKSTLIKKLVRRIRRPMVGFFTGEIRDGPRRVGFSITTLKGQKGLLAHHDLKGRFRVGKYGVNLDDIEQIAVPAMIPTTPDQLVVIDEIGKMECFSGLFKQTLVKILDSGHDVLGSIALRGGPFIQQIRQRPDVQLIHVSEENRNSLVKLAQEVYID